MAKNIQDLRREAGYRSAKDFAEAMGIALSTYNRYENQPEAIPLKQAWAIADFLGCSIDMVVGREPVSAADMRGDVQKFYDGLSGRGREMMDGYMEFVSFKEAEEAEAQREEEERKYAVLLDYYESLFLKALSDDPGYMERVMYVRKPDIRESFLEFLRNELEDQKDRMRRRFADEAVRQAHKSGTYLDGLEGLEAGPDDPGYDEAYRQRLYEQGELVWNQANGTIEGELEKLMAAFDRAHRGGRVMRMRPLALHATVEYAGQ